MVKTELIVFAALLAAVSCSGSPEISWRKVEMDGHRVGAQSVTSENVNTALGTFTEDAYIAPNGAVFALESSVAGVARHMKAAQDHLSKLKVVVGHSAGMYENIRTNPDLPLANFTVDALREYGSKVFGVKMDVGLINFGGIRCPMPEGAVTLDDISSMFPFNNYLCHCRIRGSQLLRLFEQLAGTKAFQAVSGVRVLVRDHKLVSAEIGGKPVDPDKLYNLVTIDFLLDGGDKINVGALSEDVKLSKVLIKEAVLGKIEELEKSGKLIAPVADGRVVME